MPNFEVLFMDEAAAFVERLKPKAREKLLFNIRKSQMLNDPKLFKKLNSHIWEFRSQTRGNQYRLFAFWDTTTNALVICTHGMLKKSGKIPPKEIERAERLRRQYLDQRK